MSSLDDIIARLRQIRSMTRIVKSGDIILPDDHNLLVNALDETINALETIKQQLGAPTGPPWPSPSGLSVWDFLVNAYTAAPEIYDLYKYNAMPSRLVLYIDDYIAPVNYFYRQVEATGRAIIDIVSWVYLLEPSATYLTTAILPHTSGIKTHISVDADLAYMFYAAAMQPHTPPPPGSYAVIAYVGPQAYSIDADRNLYTGDPLVEQPQPTGVQLPQWWILVAGLTPDGVQVYITDTQLNTLYSELVPTTTALLESYAGWIDLQDNKATMRYDWEIIAGHGIAVV